MARRLTAEAVLEELELDDDFDADEPMMAGSDDEFDDIDDDVNFEDMSDDDDHSSEASAPPHHPIPTAMTMKVVRLLTAIRPLPGLPLSSQSPSLPLVHQWVLRLLFRSRHSTPSSSCSLLTYRMRL